MLGMPEPTAYDLRFRFLGIPVRVHPLFWLVTAMLGWRGSRTSRSILIWIGCVFVSILVHEYGHGLMSRLFRCSPVDRALRHGRALLFRERAADPLAAPGRPVRRPGRRASLLFRPVSTAGSVSGPGISRRHRSSVGLRESSRRSMISDQPLLEPRSTCSRSGRSTAARSPGWSSRMFNRRKGMNWAHVISLVTAGLLAMCGFRINRRCSWGSSSPLRRDQLPDPPGAITTRPSMASGRRCRLVEALNVRSAARLAEPRAGSLVDRRSRGPNLRQSQTLRSLGAPFPSGQSQDAQLPSGGSCSNASGRRASDGAIGHRRLSLRQADYLMTDIDAFEEARRADVPSRNPPLPWQPTRMRPPTMRRRRGGCWSWRTRRGRPPLPDRVPLLAAAVRRGLPPDGGAAGRQPAQRDPADRRGAGRRQDDRPGQPAASRHRRAGDGRPVPDGLRRLGPEDAQVPRRLDPDRLPGAVPGPAGRRSSRPSPT